ncbi:hypothetical protein DM02DRAFT_631378 [Periconia macrospinosa]|uniref:Vacuolar import and degradation protein 21 n=1 Tax=Periconia macrospinosa TaxID=97972 RepID=A0A2V1DGC6_9PLEO|nr:hypothetical protein DM02DRAFT_631378 [Periconia macrospinosa]
MSLDGLRDAYTREKQIEVANCEQSRKRKLRELYSYTALLNTTRLLSPRDWLIPDEPPPDEAHFLDQNDISKGRRFNDASLPYPTFTTSPSLPSTLPFQPSAKPTPPALTKPLPSPVAAPSLEEQLRAASASPSVANPPIPPPEKPVKVDSTVPIRVPSPSLPRIEPPSPHAPVVEDQAANQDSTGPPPPTSTQPEPEPVAPAVPKPILRAPVPDGPSADPVVVVPPSSEDFAALSEVLPSEKEKDDAPKTPQVVHLPPLEVQEARLQETEQKLEKAAEKERKEDEKLALPTVNGSVDQPSSPSSTVGPYSQATPHAPHHSPDTSPDTDSFHGRVLPQSQVTNADDTTVPVAKDDHERALQEQMREARERARGDSPGVDDVEKQLEDEQAVRLARDGKDRLGEPEPATPAGPEALTSQAADVVHETEAEATDSGAPGVNEEPAADSLPTPTTTAPEPSTVENEATETSESAVAKLSKPDTGVEHPTPPAEVDVDVEMNDAPPPATEEKQAPSSPPRQDRMTTRVSSGAIRQKSVSEIIAEKNEQLAPKSVLTPQSSSLSTSTSPARPPREKKRRTVSTVVFAKPDLNKAAKALQLFNEDYASLQGASEDSSRDYLQGLFQYQAHHPPRSKPLQELVVSAQKTLSTAGTLAMIREQQDYKILKRVYQLQNANRWSLRQLQKSAEPERPITHQDHLLAEMKWMQTDFREERKWKKALALTFAGWCAEYIHSTAEERLSLRVRARIPKSVQQRAGSADEDMNDAPTPDLIHSGANETESESFPEDEEMHSPLMSSIPAGLFSLGFNEVVMKIDRTPASDSLFQELPWYEPLLEGAADVTPLSFVDPPILPVSKFVTGKLVSQVKGPPRKRSRYEYDSEDESSSPPSRSGTSAEHSMPSTPGRRLFHRNDLLPEMNDVALFNPENRHIRDRLQVAHQFRPPTEFPMPSVTFFENRSSSQWLWDEDQKLRALVKEYTFNWSLVAQQLALPSLFTSGSGRRTPWECFERWVQLEGLPAEMSKTQYFRTYQSRLEQAQKTVLAQHQAQQQLQQQQQQQQNGQNISTGQPRRRTTQPIRVERRRDNRHLAIIDGMRKLARKRESMAQKQADAARAAQMRKQHDTAAPKTNIQTPQEFSRLKWEREEKFKQRQMMVQQEIMQKQMAARQQQMQQAAQGGMANGVNQQRNGMHPNNPNAGMVGNPAQQTLGANAAAMAARAQQNQQAMQGNNFPGANMNGMAMGSSGVPQAQMQASMANNQRMAPPDQVRLAMQRGQFNNTNQQHQFQLQQQQINAASNLTQNMGMNGMPNANMIAAMGGQTPNGGMNGNMNGNMNGAMNGNMGGNMNGNMNGMANNGQSPRLNQANPAMQSPARPLSSGHMPQLLQIQNNLKNQHPEWTQEQVQKYASDHLSRFLAKQRLQAMNAATGSPGSSQSPQMGNNMYLQNVQNGGMNANSPSPTAVQNYQAQLVRQQQMMSQQQRQQQAGSPGMSAAQPSRSATPQNPNLQQHSPSIQQSPSMQQAQSNRN